jgi:hypothetical protein
MMIKRNLGGYGRTRPDIVWPNGARVAVSLVVNFEEGAELAVEQGGTTTEKYGEVQSVLPAIWCRSRYSTTGCVRGYGDFLMPSPTRDWAPHS